MSICKRRGCVATPGPVRRLDLRESAMASTKPRIQWAARAQRFLDPFRDTRPIFHQRDETIRGHVFCSFLALLFTQGLQDRLTAEGCDAEWADVIRDLDNLVEMESGHRRQRLRVPRPNSWSGRQSIPGLWRRSASPDAAIVACGGRCRRIFSDFARSKGGLHDCSNLARDGSNLEG